MSGLGRRILVVEDELLMQKMLETELLALGFEVQCADSVIDAKNTVASFDPDIALIDISLKGTLTGLHLGQMLARNNPDIAQVYLTKHDDLDEVNRDAIDFPEGSGFLSKHRIHSSQELVAEIDRVVAGKKVARENGTETEGEFLAGLGTKGRRVLELMAQGYTNQYIADNMGITAKAVEYYNEAIYKALGVKKSAEKNSRVDAAVRYQRAIFAAGLADVDLKNQ